MNNKTSLKSNIVTLLLRDSVMASVYNTYLKYGYNVASNCLLWENVPLFTLIMAMMSWKGVISEGHM